MPRLLWISLLAGSLAACSNGSEQNNSESTGNQPLPQPPTQIYTPSEPGAATDVLLQLSWEPNADAVAGYRVYFGAAPESAMIELSDLAITSRTLNAHATSVTYNAGRDLGLDLGSRACFRLRAYDSEGTLSNWSQPACATI